MFLGVLALAAVIAVGGAVAWLFHQGTQLDAEAAAYADAAIPAIVAPWNQDALLQRLTPQQRRAVTPEQLQAVAAAITRLGTFIGSRRAQSGAAVAYAAGPDGAATTALYAARVQFAGGTTTIRLLLVRQDGHWMIGGFHVQTPGSAMPQAPGPGISI